VKNRSSTSSRQHGTETHVLYAIADLQHAEREDVQRNGIQIERLIERASYFDPRFSLFPARIAARTILALGLPLATPKKS
jgi:hypothetical protein